MNSLLVANLLGWLLLGIGVVQLVPIAAAIAFGEPVLPFAASAIAAVVCGAPIVLGARPTDPKMRIREGFAIVTFAWLLASGFGSLPYDLTGTLGPIDAWFEAVSGFTTTGSTVMTKIEGAPLSLLLWRSLTQWLGGMGIIVFAVALMPVLGVGGMQLFKAEVPGPVADKLTPRIADTARRLWLVYVGLTVAQLLALWIAGLSFFEALCHSFTTMATGGFSTRDASIASFASPAVEWIVIVFMALAGANFVLHYRVLTGRVGVALRDTELRYYAALLAGASAIVAWVLIRSGEIASSAEAIRGAVFAVVSIATTTGYATLDFEHWNALALLVLLQLMILGGMAGSTAGGVKSLRTWIGLQSLVHVFDRIGHRAAVGHPVRYGGSRVPDDVIAGIWSFLTAYFLLVIAVAAIVAAVGYDLETAASAALTTVGNVGPGISEIGPFDNFAHFPGGVKLVLCVAMIAGRLELFTVLVLFHPDFWRR